MKSTQFVLLLAGTCTALSVSAAGVKEKKLWAAAIEQVNSVQVEAEKSCGIKVKFAFDQASFKARELEDYGMDGYCGDAFVAMTELCADADYKAAMKSVKELTCRFDSGIKKAVAEMKDGKIDFSFNWDTANHRTTVKKYLEDSL